MYQFASQITMKFGCPLLGYGPCSERLDCVKCLLFSANRLKHVRLPSRMPKVRITSMDVLERRNKGREGIEGGRNLGGAENQQSTSSR